MHFPACQVDTFLFPIALRYCFRLLAFCAFRDFIPRIAFIVVRQGRRRGHCCFHYVLDIYRFILFLTALYSVLKQLCIPALFLLTFLILLLK